MATTRKAFCNQIFCDAASDLPAAGKFVGQKAWVNGTNALIKSWSGSAWVDITPTFVGSGTLDHVGLLDIVSTASETTLYTFSVPASTLGTTRSMRLLIMGDYLNNSGASRTVTYRIKYGSTTMYDDVTPVITASAVRHPTMIDISMGTTGAANAEFFAGVIYMGNVGATTAGLGDISTADIAGGRTTIGGYASEDSSNALSFTVTIQHSASNANLSYRRQTASLVLL